MAVAIVADQSRGGLLGNHRVRVEGPVWTVLLIRADGQSQDRGCGESSGYSVAGRPIWRRGESWPTPAADADEELVVLVESVVVAELGQSAVNGLLEFCQAISEQVRGGE